MQDACKGHWVGQKLGQLSHASVIVHGIELSREHERIPIGHVDNNLLLLRTGILEFGEEPARYQIMVVLVDLLQGVTNFDMIFKILCPVVFAAVYGNTTIGTLEVHMSRSW